MLFPFIRPASAFLAIFDHLPFPIRALALFSLLCLVIDSLGNTINRRD